MLQTYSRNINGVIVTPEMSAEWAKKFAKHVDPAKRESFLEGKDVRFCCSEEHWLTNQIWYKKKKPQLQLSVDGAS